MNASGLGFRVETALGTEPMLALNGLLDLSNAKLPA
jgi:hypothetical protein